LAWKGPALFAIAIFFVVVFLAKGRTIVPFVYNLF
jgi:hypothetical protein